METEAPEFKEHTETPLPFFTRRRLLCALGVLFAAVGIAAYAMRPPNFVRTETIFTVAPGATLKSIGLKLESERYIRSNVIFSTIVTFFGGERHISPGDYYFKSGETVVGIARQVAFGNHNIVPQKITVPEGENVREIGQLLSQKISGFSADAFIKSAEGSEGYLFPETYFVYPTITTDEMIREMQSMFERQTSGLFTAEALGARTKSQVIVMASLIEREAHGTDDRATIAGILWKRLANGMPLQVDATVAFANGVAENSLTKSDFAVDSPYNTYKYKGLPPGPIANPGLEAITASLHPLDTAYLYYLHDKHGTIHYAKTYAEHLQNIQRYLR